jgi:hypothetical protein
MHPRWPSDLSDACRRRHCTPSSPAIPPSSSGSPDQRLGTGSRHPRGAGVPRSSEPWALNPAPTLDLIRCTSHGDDGRTSQSSARRRRRARSPSTPQGPTSRLIAVSELAARVRRLRGRRLRRVSRRLRSSAGLAHPATAQSGRRTPSASRWRPAQRGSSSQATGVGTGPSVASRMAAMLSTFIQLFGAPVRRPADLQAGRAGGNLRPPVKGHPVRPDRHRRGRTPTSQAVEANPGPATTVSQSASAVRPS